MGGGVRGGFRIFRPRGEVVSPDVAGIDAVGGVGERQPVFAAGDELRGKADSRGLRVDCAHLTPALSPLRGRRGRRTVRGQRAHEEGEHLLELAPGSAVDATEESEQEGRLGHVARDGADTLVNRRGHAAQGQIANPVKGAANQWMSASQEPDFAFLRVLRDFQAGREAGCATVEETQGHAGVSFVNAQLFGDVVVKESNHGPVRFTGCGFFGSMDGKRGTALAKLAGPGRVSFSNCHFYCIHPESRNAPEMIVAESGRLAIQGCVFMNNRNTTGVNGNPVPIVLKSGVRSAIIEGNEFYGQSRIVNQAKGRVVIANNVEETDENPFPAGPPEKRKDSAGGSGPTKL